MLSFMDSTHKI